MSDQSGAIPLGLAQQQTAQNINPEQLEMMGKRAAALYAERSCPLNEAVVEIVKEAMLSPEQVKRVCEFANTAAYLQEFEKGGEVRNVTFQGGPADPSYILKELNDGSSPAVHQVKTAAYNPPKGHYKTAGGGDAILAEAFGYGTGMSKVASALIEGDHAVRATKGEELADLKIRLEGVRDDLVSKYASSGILLNDIRGDLCDAVQQEVMSGTPMMDIAKAWYGMGDTALVKEAMRMVVGHLQTVGLEKNASWKVAEIGSQRIPNPSHPVVDRFLAFSKVASEHTKLGHARQIVEEQLQEVNKQLKEMA